MDLWLPLVDSSTHQTRPERKRRKRVSATTEAPNYPTSPPSRRSKRKSLRKFFRKAVYFFEGFRTCNEIACSLPRFPAIKGSRSQRKNLSRWFTDSSSAPDDESEDTSEDIPKEIRGFPEPEKTTGVTSYLPSTTTQVTGFKIRPAADGRASVGASQKHQFRSGLHMKRLKAIAQRSNLPTLAELSRDGISGSPCPVHACTCTGSRARNTLCACAQAEPAASHQRADRGDRPSSEPRRISPNTRPEFAFLTGGSGAEKQESLLDLGSDEWAFPTNTAESKALERGSGIMADASSPVSNVHNRTNNQYPFVAPSRTDGKPTMLPAKINSSGKRRHRRWPPGQCPINCVLVQNANS